jgi:uncharacterized LabA/DUF88 family protein
MTAVASSAPDQPPAQSTSERPAAGASGASGGTAHAPVAAARPASVALFLDWENLRITARRMEPPGDVDVDAVLKIAETYGPVVVARAYANWQYQGGSRDQRMLWCRGIEPVYVPPAFQQIEEIGAGAIRGKSTADVRLAVDAVDVVFRFPSIGTVVIASGDGSFANPSVYFRRSHGKQVVGVGFRGTSSALFLEAADLFHFIGPISQTGTAGSGERAPGPARAAAGAATQDSPRGPGTPGPGGDVTLERALEALGTVVQEQAAAGQAGLFPHVNAGLVKTLGVDHGWYTRLGFTQLRQFMEEAQRRGVVRVVGEGVRMRAVPPESVAARSEMTPQGEASPAASSASPSYAAARDEQALPVRELFLAQVAAQLDIAEKALPYVGRNGVLGFLRTHFDMGSIGLAEAEDVLERWIQEGRVIQELRDVPDPETGETRSMQTIRLNRADTAIQNHLRTAYDQHPSAWRHLSPSQRATLVAVVGELTGGAAVLTWVRLRTRLSAADSRTDWDYALATALDEGVLQADDWEVPHRRTGQPYVIRGLTLQDEHPDVVQAIQSVQYSEDGATSDGTSDGTAQGTSLESAAQAADADRAEDTQPQDVQPVFPHPVDVTGFAAGDEAQASQSAEGDEPAAFEADETAAAEPASGEPAPRDRLAPEPTPQHDGRPHQPQWPAQHSADS